MTLRIGILGAARVATYAMIAPAREVDDVVVAGVAARHFGRARAYAADHGIAKAYESYDALIEAPEIDAVYVALPPSLHARWSIAALAAGKPVLCEKPFALTLADVDAMLSAEAAAGVLLMEAQHSHYHPLNKRVRELASNGAIGHVHRIAARFDAPVADTGSELRYIRDVGGGALWDLGVYPAYWIRSLVADSWDVTSASQRLHAGGADIATDADLATSAGITATLACAMDAPLAAWLEVHGTLGSIKVRNPLAPQRGHALDVTIGGVTRTETFSLRASYAFQLEAFRDGVTGRAPVTRGADSRATIALLAAIDAKARS